MSHSIGIPSVDLNDFLSGNAEEKQAFVNALGKAYEEIGFVALKNHRLSDELVAALYREVQAFFNLPKEVKDHYEIEGIGGQRGYTGFGKEHGRPLWHLHKPASNAAKSYR